MKTISQRFGARFGVVVSLCPTESVHYALQPMAEDAAGALLVIANGAINTIMHDPSAP